MMMMMMMMMMTNSRLHLKHKTEPKSTSFGRKFQTFTTRSAKKLRFVVREVIVEV